MYRVPQDSDDITVNDISPLPVAVNSSLGYVSSSLRIQSARRCSVANLTLLSSTSFDPNYIPSWTE